MEENLEIIQNNNTYKLKIEIEEEKNITLSIIEPNLYQDFYFSRKMTFEEMKNIDKLFFMFEKFNDLVEYIKNSIDNKKLSIEASNDKIIIIFHSELLFKPYDIKIDLFKEKIDHSKIIFGLLKEINNLNEDMKKIKEENEKLKNQNSELNKKIEDITKLLEEKEYYPNSTILKNSDFILIKTTIQIKMNRNIKEIKKLYQATKDGGDPQNFHMKCDNIGYTLVLIESFHNRRFGGYTSETWGIGPQYKDDKSSFLFSLDNQKIYPYKNDNKAIFCSKDYGPCFGGGHDIVIAGNPFDDKNLKTYKCSFDYGGDPPLSEDEEYNGIYAKEYEVFQIIFS